MEAVHSLETHTITGDNSTSNDDQLSSTSAQHSSTDALLDVVNMEYTVVLIYFIMTPWCIYMLLFRTGSLVTLNHIGQWHINDDELVTLGYILRDTLGASVWHCASVKLAINQTVSQNEWTVQNL